MYKRQHLRIGPEPEPNENVQLRIGIQHDKMIQFFESGFAILIPYRTRYIKKKLLEKDHVKLPTIKQGLIKILLPMSWRLSSGSPSPPPGSSPPSPPPGCTSIRGWSGARTGSTPGGPGGGSPSTPGSFSAAAGCLGWTWLFPPWKTCSVSTSGPAWNK